MLYVPRDELPAEHFCRRGNQTVAQVQPVRSRKLIEILSCNAGNPLVGWLNGEQGEKRFCVSLFIWAHTRQDFCDRHDRNEEFAICQQRMGDVLSGHLDAMKVVNEDVSVY